MIGQYRFNEDQLRQLLTNGEPSIADLANEIIPARDQAHDLVFAKTNLAQTILNFRRRADLLNPHCHARLHAAQRTNFAVGFLG